MIRVLQLSYRSTQPALRRHLGRDVLVFVVLLGILSFQVGLVIWLFIQQWAS